MSVRDVVGLVGLVEVEVVLVVVEAWVELLPEG